MRKHLYTFDARRCFYADERVYISVVVVWSNNERRIERTNGEGVGEEKDGKKKMGKKDCTIWRVIAAWWNARTCARTRGLPRFVRVSVGFYERLCNPRYACRVKYPRGTRA